MSIIRWQPFHDLVNTHNRVHRLFDDDYFGDDRDANFATTIWTPLADIFETKDNFILKVELPGFKKEDVSIEISGEQMIIKGERKQDQELQKENCYRIERNFGSFQRTFLLPKNIAADKVMAELKDGLLTLELPKLEEAKPRTVSIKAH